MVGLVNNDDGLAYWIPRVFNSTALGFGVLLGGWHAYQQNWFEAGFIFFVMVPVYFLLRSYFDAP